MKKSHLLGAVCACIAFVSLSSNAATITFDDVISGATSFGFDGDGDLVNDVIFTTTDVSGFNTAGPGSNMSYINEPGLEGTTTISPDLRVDFLNGAVVNLNFGFAVSSTSGGIDGVTFSIFDSSDNLLNSVFQTADFTFPDGTNPSSFPEALVSLSFAGTASYAIFDFSTTEGPRYILDNFSGTFGSTEDITPAPVPAAVWLFGSGLLGLIGITRRKKA